MTCIRVCTYANTWNVLFVPVGSSLFGSVCVIQFNCFPWSEHERAHKLIVEVAGDSQPLHIHCYIRSHHLFDSKQSTMKVAIENRWGSESESLSLTHSHWSHSVSPTLIGVTRHSHWSHSVSLESLSLTHSHWSFNGVSCSHPLKTVRWSVHSSHHHWENIAWPHNSMLNDSFLDFSNKPLLRPS